MKTKMMAVVVTLLVLVVGVGMNAHAQYSTTFNKTGRQFAAFEALLELTPHYGQLIGISWESDRDKLWFLVDAEGGIYLQRQNFATQEITPTILLATLTSLGRVVVGSIGVRYGRLGVLELFLNGHRVARLQIRGADDDIQYTVGVGVFASTAMGLKSTVRQFTVSELGLEFMLTE